ncbi:MAG: hypothetical protein IPG96_04150 [Proteobacteria bacterium]|nr:hypothetical protein [Pseudomonadota bacterium]
MMRLLLGAVRLLVVLLLALGAAVACWLRFAPDELLRRALVVAARGALELPAFDLEGLELRLGLRGSIILRGLVVGPPRGFTLPALTLDRLTLRYDLRQLPQGVVTVSRFELERPIVRLEQRGQRLSWLALAGGTGRVPPADAAEPAPAAGSTPPATLDLRLQQALVRGLALYFDDGSRRVVVDGLDLRARARLVRGQGQARVVVALAPPPTQSSSVSSSMSSSVSSSVALAQRAPVALRATLDTRLRAVLDLEALAPLRAALTASLDLRTRTLVAPWALPPTAVALRCDAEVDQASGRALLRRLTLALNGQRLLRLQGRVEGLGGRPLLTAELSRLFLPLAALLPYARLVQPALRATGTVAAERVRAEVALPAQGQPQLKTLRGAISLHAVSAALPAAGMAVSGLEGGLSFDLVPGRAAAGQRLAPTAPARPDGTAALRLAWRELHAGPTVVGDLALAARAGFSLRELRPTVFDTALELRLGSLQQRHPRWGWLRTSARLSARLVGDAEQRRAELSALRLELGRQLRVGLRASTRDWAAGAGEARLELEPVSLAGVWRELPAALRQTLPLSELGGEVALSATVRGRLPAAGTSPLRLPLELMARLDLRDVRLAQRAPVSEAAPASEGAPLRVAGLSGTITARSANERATLEGRLALASLDQAATGLRLRGLGLPFSVTATPLAVSADARLTLGRLEQQQLAATLSQRDLALRARASATLPLERLLTGQFVALDRASVALSLEAAQTAATQPSSDLRLERLRGEVTADYDAHRAAEPLRWQAGLGLGALRERVQALRLDELALRLRGTAGGWIARLPLSVVTPAELWAGVQGTLALGRVGHPALLRPLGGTRLELAARLHPRGAFELERLTLALPTLGLSAAASATLERPWEFVAAAGVGRRELPLFELHLRGELSSPSATQAAAARVLHEGLRSAGALGVQLHLRAIDRARLQLDGRLSARRFSLWVDGAPRALAAAGPQGAGWLRSHLYLAGLDADVPIAQQLVVGAGEALPTLALPPPRHSIFDQTAVGAAYRLVRPFVGGRSNLSFDGLTLRSELLAGPQEHARRRSQSALQIGRTVLDLALRDGTLWLNHLALQALGGDLAGELQLQLLSLAPLNLRLRADTRLTNVDLARLDPQAAARGRQTRISALAALKYELSSQALSGQLLLDDLSLDTLDSLLAYLDPHGLDPTVQANRRLINAWYTRWTRPQVERVALWIAHSQLNLDIRLGAVWPLGAVLRRALHGVRIRRVSLRPFLPAGDEVLPPQSPLPAARPAWGHWEPPASLSVE